LELTKFFLDNVSKNKYESAHIDLEEYNFYPESELGMVFIPNYLYIPPEILHKMKLKNSDIDDLHHVQQLLWSRIKEAQVNAFLDRQFRLQLY
jgi:hypothetical protein